MKPIPTASADLDYPALASAIKEWGRELGFQQVGISDIGLGEHSLAGIRIERHILQAPLLHPAFAQIEGLQRIQALHARKRHPHSPDHGVVVRADRAGDARSARAMKTLLSLAFRGAAVNADGEFVTVSDYRVPIDKLARAADFLYLVKK